MPTVLIVAASPLDQDRLSLSREVKKIKQSLERSRNRESWKIESNEAATVEDLRRALLDYQPSILHFSGHGAGDSGLCFEDDQGLTHLTQAAPLTKLVHHFKDKLRCVVLNACYSEIQADAIRQEIDYVVGMRSSISDEAATKFAVAFYDSVFAGTTFRMAFDIGCAAIDLYNLPGTDVPVFLSSPQLGGIDLAYTGDIPQIEDVLHAYMNTPYTERYRFATRGEKLLGVMKRHYGNSPWTPVAKVTVISKQQIDDLHWLVVVHSQTTRANDKHEYFIRIEDGIIKIDWRHLSDCGACQLRRTWLLGQKRTLLLGCRLSLIIAILSHSSTKGSCFRVLV